MSFPLTPEQRTAFTQNVTALVDYLSKSDNPNNQAIAQVIRALGDECERLADENAVYFADKSNLETQIASISRGYLNLATENTQLVKDTRRLDWCAENEIQFGVERGAIGHADRWIVFQKQRWDLPLGTGWTARAAIDSAMGSTQLSEEENKSTTPP